MQVKKSALYKGNKGKHTHLIEQLENNSIKVTAGRTKTGNTKAQLRLLAKHCGFNYDDKWNTRTFGAKFIDFLHEKDPNSVMLDDNAKKMAIILDKDEQGNLFKHTIEQSANSENENTITVKADSTKAVLRLIFNDMGVKYDNNWNTQTMGAKLIELINNPTNQSSDDDYDYDAISDKNWEWWLSLDRNTRFILLYQYHDELQNEYQEDEDGVLEIYYDEELQTDRSGYSGYMSYLLDDYIMAFEWINISHASQSEEASSIEFYFPDFKKLAHLPYLTTLIFSDEDGLTEFPEGLDKLNQLTMLNFYRTNIGEADPEKNIKTLIKTAKSLPNLEHLILAETPLADWLENNNEKLDELKSLLPNCDIKV